MKTNNFLLRIYILTFLAILISCNNDNNNLTNPVNKTNDLQIKGLIQKPIIEEQATMWDSSREKWLTFDSALVVKTSWWTPITLRLENTINNIVVYILLDDNLEPISEDPSKMIFLTKNNTQTYFTNLTKNKAKFTKNPDNIWEMNKINMVTGGNQGSIESIDLQIILPDEVIHQGESTLTIEGDKAILTGILGIDTYNELLELNTNNPEIKTLVLSKDINGFMNDPINLKTGSLIREADYSVTIMANAKINSGAVDLFIAGKNRKIEEGAMIGIHSGQCCSTTSGLTSFTALGPINKKLRLNYFKKMLGDVNGTKFFNLTRLAETTNDTHWLNDNEIALYNLTTE